MKATSDAKPPSARQGAARPQPAKARPGGVTAETFSRFVRNLAKLEGGRAQSGSTGRGGEGGR
ncbi:hypothetical protein [Bosea minatitlanensis]|uniref:Uncharacterized protein n=1 Tax=Bosea minatitlanensis TaxID=128782 RepID=A0ABW0F3J0_9HYPH|nr:hypothetical protein [Bosea minatitlanensis]MCT4492858.1 hypothetical protein [Bosea minatitlanensis]